MCGCSESPSLCPRHAYFRKQQTPTLMYCLEFPHPCHHHPATMPSCPWLEQLQFSPHCHLICGWLIIEVSLTKTTRLPQSWYLSPSSNPAETGLCKMSALTHNRNITMGHASGMAGSRGSCLWTPLAPALGSAFLQIDFIHWGRFKFREIFLLTPRFEPVAVVRGCNRLSALAPIPGVGGRVPPK